MNRAQPELGCCSWEREIAADDVQWQPIGFSSQQDKNECLRQAVAGSGAVSLNSTAGQS